MLLLILFFVKIAVCLSTAGEFNIREVRDISYKTILGDNEFWFLSEFDISKVHRWNIDQYEKELRDAYEKKTRAKHILVSNSNGRKYMCFVPDISENTEATPEKVSRNPEFYSSIIGAGFYVNKCIKSANNGWWKYKLCRGKMVDQIHGDQEDADYMVVSLGLFDSKFSMPEYQTSTSDRLLYVEESYSGGDLCDLGNYKGARKTVVRYYCNPVLETNEAYIESINEHRPCEYILNVKIGSICVFPEFLPPVKRHTHQIECQPVMTVENIRESLEIAVRGENDPVENLRNKVLVSAMRYIAMNMSKLEYMKNDHLKLFTSYLDLKNDLYDYIIAQTNYDGIALTLETKDKLWTSLKNFIFDKLPGLCDDIYQSVDDKNNAFMWYYFYNKNWPKSYFPRDLEYAVIADRYFRYLHVMWDNPEHLYFRQDPKISSVDAMMKFGISDIHNNVLLDYSTIISSLFKVFKFSKLDKAVNYLRDKIFLSSNDEVEELMKNYMNNVKFELPMNGESKRVLDLLFVQIPIFLDVVAKNGIESIKNELNVWEIYEELKITKNENQKSKYKYELQFVKTQDVIKNIEKVYELQLSFIYREISHKYFAKLDSGAFNPEPEAGEVADNHLPFHKAIGMDFLEFCNLLTEATIWKIEKEIWMYGNQEKPLESDSTVERFLSEWPNVKKVIPSKEFEVELAIHDILKRSGNLVDTVRYMVWDDLKQKILRSSDLMKNEQQRSEKHQWAFDKNPKIFKNLNFDEIRGSSIVLWCYEILAGVISPSEETNVNDE